MSAIRRNSGYVTAEKPYGKEQTAVMGGQKSSISVLIGAFHGEKYITALLESLFRQTRVPMEILIGDDSEDDATFRAVESVRGRYSGNLRYIRNSERLGVTKNFVNLVREAKGDIIFFCDQDDVWLPSKIEILAGHLESGSDIQVAACGSLLVDDNLNSLHESLLQNVSGLLDTFRGGTVPFPYILLQKISFVGHNLAMKKTFREQFLKIPDDYGFYHDLWLTQIAALCDVLSCVNKDLTYYRIHSQNLSAPVFPSRQRSLIGRVRQIFFCSEDFSQTLRMQEALLQFVKITPGLPAENCAFLKDCHRYFSARGRVRSLMRPFRFLALTPSLLRDYFRIGTGWRGLLRDQLL